MLFRSYTSLNATLIDTCKKFNFGKYSNIAISQIYNEECLYEINNKSYIVLIFDDKLNLEPKVLELNKSNWNSEKDFSSENKATEQILYSYASTKESLKSDAKLIATEDSEVDSEVDVNVSIENDEFLYGGTSDWFYGIWKGALEDCGFNEEKLLEFKKESENFTTQSEFDGKRDATNSKFSEEETKSEDTVHFYLPQANTKNNEEQQTSYLPIVKNAGVDYVMDLNNSLLGTIAVNNKLVKESNGKEVVSDYYSPLINENTIHAERTGGNSYYEIEGLFETSSVSSTEMKMPSIRRTFTTGKDITPNVEVSVGLTVEEIGRAHV